MATKVKTQSERFEEAAHEPGVDLNEDQLRRTLGKLATVKEADVDEPKGDEPKD